MKNRKNYFILGLLCLTFCITGTAQSLTNPAAELQLTVTHKLDSIKQARKRINREAYRTARKYGYVKVLRKSDRMYKAQLASLTPVRKLKIHVNSKAQMRRALKKQCKERQQEITTAMKEELGLR